MRMEFFFSVFILAFCGVGILDVRYPDAMHPLWASVAKKTTRTKESRERWILSDSKIEWISRVHNLEQMPIRVSSSCIQSAARMECEAWSAALKVTNSNFEPALAANAPAGSEPGSRLCKIALAASVIFGRNERGDLNAFCVFKDASMISTGSLYALYSRARGMRIQSGRDPKPSGAMR